MLQREREENGPGFGFRWISRLPMKHETPRLRRNRIAGREPLSREKTNAAQRQADRRTSALLGLVILVLLGFAFTIQTLWVSVVRSGLLGDNTPAAGWMLLVGLVGLTI